MAKVLTKNLTQVITEQIKKTFGNKIIRAITFSFLFFVSGIGASIIVPASAATNRSVPTVLASSAISQAEANWAYPNGNAFNQGYNPINQINSSSAAYLGLSWLYPLPTLPTTLVAQGPGGVGVGMQVLVVNGTAYATTLFDEVIAFNVANGNVLWTFTAPLRLNQTIQGVSKLSLHQHDGDEWFTTVKFGSGVSGPTLWIAGANHFVYAISAVTGKQELNFTIFTGRSMIPGNSPTSVYDGPGAAGMIIDQQKGVLISSEMCAHNSNCGRGFFAGWDLNANPPSVKWLAYPDPPQSGGNVPVDPMWSIGTINNMSSAETFFPGKGAVNGYTSAAELQGGLMMNTNDNIVVNWKSMSQSQLNASLYDDWGQVHQTAQCQAISAGMSSGTTGPGWGGQWIIGSGPTSGMAFIPTNNRDPYVGPCEPGPDLWAAAILAINVTNGHWIWAFQATPHDVWDYDCSWWQATGNETINGVNTPVIYKTCKDGFLYEINALTGHLLWAWVPPTNVIQRCQWCWPMDPTNKTQMSFDFPSAFGTFKTQSTTGPQPGFLEYPAAIAGFEDEQAYNPKTNTLFVASHLVPYYAQYIGFNASTYFNLSGQVLTPVAAATCKGNIPVSCSPSDENSTIWSINAATGKVNWHYFIPLQGFRGDVTLAGDLVLSSLSSGDILMLNQANGQLVRDYYIGAPMAIGVSVGASVGGQEYLFTPVGTCSGVAVIGCSGGGSGDIVALSLQNVPAGAGGATTVTTTQTSVSTTVSTTTVGGGAAATTTVTSVQTTGGASGIDPTTFYGVAAVAVIFIIATGFLAMRGRKPAP